VENKDATVFELWIARAIQKGMSKGDLASFRDLCNRVFGLPKQSVNVEADIEHRHITVKVIKNENE
jgi:hypothetical protein